MSTSAKRPGRAPAKSYHHGDLRNALLAAARDLLAEAGIDGFGLREVSRRAGVSHAAAYNHFANRSELVATIVTDAFAALAVDLRHAEAEAGTPRERLEATGVAYVLFAFDRAAEFRIMFRPELFAVRDGAKQHATTEVGMAAYSPLVRAIAACRADGTLAGDPDTLALAAWSVVHGLASLVIDGPLREQKLDRAAVKTLAQNVVGIMFAR